MIPVDWAPRPEVLAMYERLKEGARTGEPSRLNIFGVQLVCYFYRRPKSPRSCELTEGVMWRMKRPNQRYESCSTETAQRLIAELLGTDE